MKGKNILTKKDKQGDQKSEKMESRTRNNKEGKREKKEDKEKNKQKNKKGDSIFMELVNDQYLSCPSWTKIYLSMPRKDKQRQEGGQYLCRISE